MGQEIRKFLEKEVYVAGVEDDFDEMHMSEELFICETLEGLHEHLNSLTPSMDSDVKVLHGVLTNGLVLPSKLHRRSVFLLIPNEMAAEGMGAIKECDVDDIDDLAEKITNMVAEGQYYIWDPSDIFILYGYEIKVTLGIADDDVDDEAIASGHKILDEVKQIAKAHSAGG